MILRRGLLGFILLFAVGCASSQIDASFGSDPNQDSDSNNASQLNGKLLYEQNCSACHGSIAFSDKKFAKATQIKAAIGYVEPMNTLDHLGNNEIEAIALALAQDHEKPESVAENFSKQAVQGNREYVASKLRKIFSDETSPNAAEQRINSTVSDLVESRATAFGGICTDYEDNCPGSFGSNSNVAISMPANVAQSGYLVRACQEVLAENQAVQNALSRSGVNQNSAADENAIQSLFKLFYPGRQISGGLVQSLMQVFQAGAAQEFTTLDAWRFTILPLCTSSMFGLI